MSGIAEWVDSAQKGTRTNLFFENGDAGLRRAAMDAIELACEERDIACVRMPWGMVGAAAGRDNRLLYAGAFEDEWSRTVTEEARNAPILIIDDLGIGPPDYNELFGFFTLVDRRYMDERPIAAATPFTKDELFHQLNVEDEAVTAEKVVSRLFHEAEIISSL